MFSPVVIPLPAFLLGLAALAVGLYAAYRYLQADVWDPWEGQTWAAPAPTGGGRHRLGATPDQYRPRRRAAVIDLTDVHQALAVQHGWALPMIEIAGHDDRPSPTTAPVVEGTIRELTSVQ